MAKKKITLKNANGQDSLYPRTAASQVEVTANTTLDTYMKGMVDSISDGTTVVVKKANEAVSLTNAPSLAASGTNKVTVTAGGKTSEAFTVPFATNATNANVANAIKDDKGNSKDWAALDTYIGGKIGDATGEVYDYVDDKIQGIIGGELEITIQEATEGASGAVKLATVADVEKQNDSLDNTSDSPKAVTPNTLWRYLKSIKGSNNGIASLDETGKVPSAQLPSYVDDVLEFANKASFPTTGEGSKIYIDLATNKVYRWGGSTYVEVSSPLAIGETTGTAYDGAKGKANADAISALQTRVGTAEGDITTINGEIESLKTKDESHDNSITAINTALYGTGNNRKFVTLTEFNPVKLNADDVPALVTWKNQVSQRTEIDGEIVSVFSAIADGEGKDIASTYAKKTDIKEVDKTTVEGLIGVSGLTYSEDGTVTY